MKTLKEIIKIVSDLNVTNIKVYDMEQSSPLFDYVAIATVANERQSNGIVRDLKEKCNAGDFTIRGIEGSEISWTLVDCGSIVLHIFNEDTREYYGLDKIYGIHKTVEGLV